MSSPQPNCLDCVGDSQVVAMAKISNNLALLFLLMSSNSFTPKFVAITGSGCGCSEIQILATLNNNVAGFYAWYLDNGGGGGGSFSGVDPTVTSWAELAAIATVSVTPPQIKVWVEASTGVTHVTQLRTGTDATDTASGVQRPSDYSGGNTKVWYDMFS